MQKYIDTINSNTDPSVRFLLIHNNTKQVIYPALIGYTFENKELITDNSKYGDIPSGFELQPDEYKLIKVPRYINSGRISARTNCQMLSNTYIDSGTQQKGNGLFCSTGDCRMPFPSTDYSSSDSGLKCQNIGAKPPTTPIEFTFDESENDFYDISQVDGNNLSASMEPISKYNTNVPDKVNPNFWCKKSECNPTLDCPAELKVWSNDNKVIACQTICSAVSGMATNFDANGKQVPPPRIANGDGTIYQDFTGPMMDNDPKSYNLLVDYFKTSYTWDPDQTTPDINDPYNRSWTKKGRWVKGNCNPNEPNCISLQNLVCCDNKLSNGQKTYCGDGLANASGAKLPVYTSLSDQACSPYVDTGDYFDEEYPKHVCWSENWPKSENLIEYCNSHGITECNYHSIFKNQCNDAYSWAFDDLSSTFNCGPRSSLDVSVSYLIEFSDYSNGPGPKPPSPTPSPPGPSNWVILLILIILIILLFLI